MINAADLKTRTVKDLAAMARKKNVLGWHAMRKEELVRILLRLGRAEGAKNGGPAGTPVKIGFPNGNAKHNGNGAAKTVKPHAEPPALAAANLPDATKPRSPHMERRLREIKSRLAEAKDLSFRTMGQDRVRTKDRLVVMVRDPYWLHAYWELNRRSIERAQAAMGQHWHAAGPVLRVHEIGRNGTTNAARQAVRDIAIHGGVNTWYIDVQHPPRSYQLEIGYGAPGGRFYCLARSNIVTTPAVGTSNAFDRNWAEVAKDFDHIYAMTAGSSEQDSNGDLNDVMEERLHRPVGDAAANAFGPGAAGVNPKREFPFRIDTELIVHGVTHPSARVTLRGEPVRLRPDGTFAVRFNLPDRRHVLPLVASSGDGAQQQTIVLAVDRNMKIMEPILREPGE